MEDGVLSPATMFGVPSDSAMDLDFMDELFLDGCWLETREGNDFLSQTTTTTSFIPNNPNTSLFDPLFPWPILDNNAQMNSTTPISQDHQSLPTEAQPNTDLARSLWIAPKRIGSDSEPSPAGGVIERLYRALTYIQDVIKDKSVLVQIWVPVNKQGKRVLVTSGLPFALDNSCKSLAKYRDISAKYQFSTEEDKGNDPEGSRELKPGLPGRVFLGKVPEWTPDVRFFRNDEYPRLQHAHLYDVRGTLALPVFEQGSRTCLGVVEIVMTTQNIKYRPELESVCKALEAVDLKSSEVLGATLNVYNKHYQTAMPEIQEVLRHACDTHRLPLAQTWVPCSYQAKEGCRHSDENFGRCVSTVDYACHVADPRVQGFHEACSEHHLLRGQGVVGSAFATNQPCFSEDVRTYVKAEYPLSHHASLFGMRAAVAIRLRSTHTGPADFVLEFFLPLDCVDPEEQRRTLNSLSLIIQQCCRTLRVVSAEELEEEEERCRGSREAAAAAAVEEEEEEVKPAKEATRVVESMEECSVIGEGSFSSKVASGERRRTKAEKNITLEVLRQYFAGSLKDAAKSIGVCSTTLKRICRQHGIKRWPSRKIKKVGHSLQKLQLVIDSVQGASGAFQIDSFYSNFPELASPNVSNTSHFSASKLHPKYNQPPPPELKAQPNNNNEAQATSKSSSSCSQSSSSSQCCTSRSDQNAATPALKRVRSEAVMNKEENDDDDEGDNIIVKKTIMPRSQSQKSLLEHHRRIKKITSSNNHHNLVVDNNNSDSLRPKCDEFHRVKVTFGDEKTRFRMHRSWGFADLQREIAGRFGIEDMGVFTIKYLDDDSEWVLLTCEADLEECFEVCRTCQTIKLSIQVSRAFVTRSL